MLVPNNVLSRPPTSYRGDSSYSGKGQRAGTSTASRFLVLSPRCAVLSLEGVQKTCDRCVLRFLEGIPFKQSLGLNCVLCFLDFPCLNNDCVSNKRLGQTYRRATFNCAHHTPAVSSENTRKDTEQRRIFPPIRTSQPHRTTSLNQLLQVWQPQNVPHVAPHCNAAQIEQRVYQRCAGNAAGYMDRIRPYARQVRKPREVCIVVADTGSICTQRSIMAWDSTF